MTRCMNSMTVDERELKNTPKPGFSLSTQPCVVTAFRKSLWLGYFREKWFQDTGPLPPGSTIHTSCPRRTQLQLAIEPNTVKCQSTGAITCINVTCDCFREKSKSCVEKEKGNALQKFHTYKQKAISSKYSANNYLIALYNFDLAYNTELQLYHLLLYPSFSPHTHQ